jgi:hypothetical protein
MSSSLRDAGDFCGLVSCPRNTRYIVAIKMGRRQVGPSRTEEGRPVSQSKSPRTSANHSKECNGKSAQILDGLFTMTDWSTCTILFGLAAFVGKSIILTRYSLCGSSS